jgi:hypothetical protein
VIGRGDELLHAFGRVDAEAVEEVLHALAPEERLRDRATVDDLAVTGAAQGPRHHVERRTGLDQGIGLEIRRPPLPRMREQLDRREVNLTRLAQHAWDHDAPTVGDEGGDEVEYSPRDRWLERGRSHPRWLGRDIERGQLGLEVPEVEAMRERREEDSGARVLRSLRFREESEMCDADPSPRGVDQFRRVVVPGYEVAFMREEDTRFRCACG